MRYEGNKVVISESEIRYLVNESVKNYLRENGEDEIFDGLRSVVGAAGRTAKQALQRGYENTKQGLQRGYENTKQGLQRGYENANNLGTNIAQTYNQGNINTKIQKEGQKVVDMLNNFVKDCNEFGNAELVSAGQECVNRIYRAMAASQNRMNAVSKNTFSTNQHTY